MVCVFTLQAERNLERIADYIALDNPMRAVSFIQEMKARCHHILHAPYGYPLAPAYGDGVRKAHFGKYLILYTVMTGNLAILHIVHSARDWTLEQ